MPNTKPDAKIFTITQSKALADKIAHAYGAQLGKVITDYYLYSRWESNPHSRKNWILNPARLPIPPLEHK